MAIFREVEKNLKNKIKNKIEKNLLGFKKKKDAAITPQDSTKL